MCRIYCISATPIPVINPNGRTTTAAERAKPGHGSDQASSGTGRLRGGQKLISRKGAIGSGPDFTIALLDRLRADGIDPAQLKTREA